MTKKPTPKGRAAKRRSIPAVHPTLAPPPVSLETLEPLKKRFIELLRTGTYSLRAACDAIGKAPVTVWRWRKDDAAFDAAVVEAYQDADSVRVPLVEDSLFKRLVEGKASPIEMIFYLKNRAPERWKDRRENAVTVDDVRGRVTGTIATIRATASSPEEAERIIAALQPVWS